MATHKPLVVRLDGIYAALNPEFSFPHDYIDTADEAISRIAAADIVISTRSTVNRAAIDAWAAAHSRPKLITLMATGSDCIDLEACKEHGILVRNVPAASNEAVAEHALALFLAARRKIVRMHEIIVADNVWMQKGTTVKSFGPLPTSCAGEVVTIVGAGDLGNRIASVMRALGTTVVLAERKGVPESSVRPGRVCFPAAIAQCTVLLMTCPLNPSTIGMIDVAELQSMRRDALVINVARGGVVAEEALVKALREEWIEGAATDVFIEEPVGAENSVLVRALQENPGLNLTLSPHIAWYAKSSVEALQKTTIANIEAFMKGEAINVVV